MDRYIEDRTRFEVITLLAAKGERTQWGITKDDVHRAFNVVNLVDKEMENRRNKNE